MPADPDGRPEAAGEPGGPESIPGDDFDSTRHGASPPPAPAAPRASDATSSGIRLPPPGPASGVPGPRTREPVPPAPTDEGPLQGGTVSLDLSSASDSIQWAESHFLRVEPPERSGDIVRLDPSLSEYRIGRLEESELRLYTSSASRDHARIARCPDGSLVLKPSSHRPIRANGRRVVSELLLEPGAYLQFGDDEFVFQGAERSAKARERPSEASRDHRLRIAVAVACASLLACAAMLLHLLLS